MRTIPQQSNVISSPLDPFFLEDQMGQAHQLHPEKIITDISHGL